LLNEGYRLQIGTRSHIKVWKESWLRRNHSLRLNSEQHNVLHHLAVNDLTLPCEKRWNALLIFDLLGKDVVGSLLHVPLKWICVYGSPRRMVNIQSN